MIFFSERRSIILSLFRLFPVTLLLPFYNIFSTSHNHEVVHISHSALRLISNQCLCFEHHKHRHCPCRCHVPKHSYHSSRCNVCYCETRDWWSHWSSLSTADQVVISSCTTTAQANNTASKAGLGAEQAQLVTLLCAFRSAPL